MEEWRDIEGYEGLYQVSSEGRVKSLGNNKSRKEKLLKPAKRRDGYLMICFCKEGKKNFYLVHRLVYEAFNGTIPEGFEVNHINEDKENNSLENLNLMTHQDNMRWGTGIERMAKAKTNNPKISKQVVGKDEQGNILFIFPSTMEAGRNGFNQGCIAACCRGCFSRQGNNKYKGLYWNYV